MGETRNLRCMFWCIWFSALRVFGEFLFGSCPDNAFHYRESFSPVKGSNR
jgi:hypothetical protein